MQFKLPLQERVLKEQTVVEESGTRRLKTKEDGAMGFQILQNPSDLDATYREKEGKQNRGYTANIVETVESMEKTEEPTVLITDGAYSGRDNTNAAIISTRLDNAGYHFQKTNVKTVHTVTSATPSCSKDQTEKYKELSRIRNGVETIPSILWRKYQIDHMPVRGLLPH